MSKISAVIAFLCLTTPATARTPATTLPSAAELTTLTRRTLLLWNQGVQQKDFTVLYKTGATAFKKKMSPKKMRRAFRGFIKKKTDISSIRTLLPVFLPQPFIGPEHGIPRVLHVGGYFETKPERTEFQLMFIREHNVWKVALICVSRGGSFVSG